MAPGTNSQMKYKSFIKNFYGYFRTTLIKINNSFSEWEQAFYASQPMARKAGLIELFHGMSEEDPQTVHFLVHVQSKESMDKFILEAGEDIAKSGHIFESTEVTFLTN